MDQEALAQRLLATAATTIVHSIELKDRKRPEPAAQSEQRNVENMEIISTSPSKRFEVQADVWEARNSLWVYSPCIWDGERDARLLSFKNESWSVDTGVWLDETTVRLCLRKFPGNHRPEQLSVEVDCLALTAVVATSAKIPLIELEEALDRALTWV
jgi:hypothetical protein